MPIPKQLLSDIASSLRIVGAPPAAEPGVPLTLGLSPLLGPIQLSSVVDKLINLQLVDGKLAGELTGDLPVSGVGGIVDRPLDLDLAGDLTGTLTGALPVATLVQAVPRITIAWEVRDEANKLLRSEEHYVAPDGTANLFFNLLLLPEFEQAGLTTPAAVKRIVSATVTLSSGTPNVVAPPAPFSARAKAKKLAKRPVTALGDEVSVTLKVPGVTILMPVIPIPRMLVMAKDLNFHGPVAIILSQDSFAGSVPTLLEMLRRIQSVLSLLTGVAKLAATLAGINALINMLEAPNIGVGVAGGGNKFNDLNDVDVDAGPWYSRFNDIEAEDTMSSFVYIGPPRKSVDLFVDQNCASGEGQFRVTAGAALVALSRSMHGSTPDLFPNMANGLPFGASINVIKPKGNFGNCISSVRFN